MYGLCVIVHVMLHNSYMEIEKKATPEGSFHYQPKSHYKRFIHTLHSSLYPVLLGILYHKKCSSFDFARIRYWNVGLWKNLFDKLLNSDPAEDHLKLLRSLKESFQNYMCSDQKLVKKLKQLLVKQRTSLCST